MKINKEKPLIIFNPKTKQKKSFLDLVIEHLKKNDSQSSENSKLSNSEDNDDKNASP